MPLWRRPTNRPTADDGIARRITFNAAELSLTRKPPTVVAVGVSGASVRVRAAPSRARRRSTQSYGKWIYSNAGMRTRAPRGLLLAHRVIARWRSIQSLSEQSGHSARRFWQLFRLTARCVSLKAPHVVRGNPTQGARQMSPQAQSCHAFGVSANVLGRRASDVAPRGAGAALPAARERQ
jgi:hypothetical protein